MKFLLQSDQPARSKVDILQQYPSARSYCVVDSFVRLVETFCWADSDACNLLTITDLFREKELNGLFITLVPEVLQ